MNSGVSPGCVDLRPFMGLLLAIAVGCATMPSSAAGRLKGPQDLFWMELHRLCDRHFVGTIIASPPDDPGLATKTLTADVDDCTDDEVKIPLHVGGVKSRMLIITRREQGLVLTEKRASSATGLTTYEGRSISDGTERRQQFEGKDAVQWVVELSSGGIAYRMLRGGDDDRDLRIQFEPSKP